MKSIIQREKYCYLCDAMDGNFNQRNLHSHHIFGGSANRKHSERYGLKVWLCMGHHTEGKEAVHRNKGNAEFLHIIGQRAFELQHGSRTAFIEIFGKNYLQEAE